MAMACADFATDLKQVFLPRHCRSTSDSEMFLCDAHVNGRNVPIRQPPEPGEKENYFAYHLPVVADSTAPSHDSTLLIFRSNSYLGIPTTCILNRQRKAQIGAGRCM